MTNRQNMRLTGYDYSQPGSYFVTFCTKDRIEYLASVGASGNLTLSREEEAVRQALESLITRFPSIILDEFIVMPNHVHAVIHLTENELHLGQVIRTLKAVSSSAIRRFNSHFAWQTDYYDRIVRSKYELDRIRNYIISNPATWHRDPDNLRVPENHREARDIWDVRNELRGHTQ